MRYFLVWIDGKQHEITAESRVAAFLQATELEGCTEFSYIGVMEFFPTVN